MSPVISVDTPATRDCTCSACVAERERSNSIVDMFDLGHGLQDQRVSEATKDALQNPERPNRPASEWFSEVLSIARSSRSASVRIAAVRAIANNAAETTVDLLSLFDSMTYDDNPEVRCVALQGLLQLWKRQGNEVAQTQLAWVAASHHYSDVRALAKDILAPPTTTLQTHWKRPDHEDEDIDSWETKK